MKFSNLMAVAALTAAASMSGFERNPYPDHPKYKPTPAQIKRRKAIKKRRIKNKENRKKGRKK